MQDLTTQLAAGNDLSDEQVEHAVGALVSTATDARAKGEFLAALRAKGETAAEIAAFAKALLAHAVDPGIDAASLPGPMIDVCGTGGDKLELFNISTTSMFVLAAGGAVVVKHGNRAITSQCGGADVLEALGIPIETSPAELGESLKALGLGFLFAPAYHPAFKAIGPVRKELASRGIATVFNLLGPLLNPARPAYQLVGIFDPELLEKYATVLSRLGRSRAWVVSNAGADEILPMGQTQVYEATPRGVSRKSPIEPLNFGIPLCKIDDLKGGDRSACAATLEGILDGSVRGAKRDTVLLNAGAGFVVAGLAADLREGITLAQEQIDSGRARAKLRALRERAL